jgi:hypothetical protein
MVAMSSAASVVAMRRGSVITLCVLVVAAALGVAVFQLSISPDQIGAFGRNAATQAGNAAATLRALGTTVGQIFETRSPGERLSGSLAILKPKRHPAIHERALPKIRHPLSPLAAIVGAPALPPILPPVPNTSLYDVVKGTPAPLTAPLTGGAAPVVFPGAPPLPGGGGGGVIFPPVVTQPPETPPAPPPETPPAPPPGTPTTQLVPEPTSWAMMLVGFALIGGRLRRTGRARLRPV